MTLIDIVEQYANLRKALGQRFSVNEKVLKTFCRAMGQGANVADVSPEHVNRFLSGKGALTSGWHIRHRALVGFYRYAISRGLASASPLPLIVPKQPPAPQPYIYTQDELLRLLDSTESYQRHRSILDPLMVRAFILLMYGAALRTSEALSLTIANVDLTNSHLIVRDSKFFKSRIVPLGVKTVQVLVEYASRRHAFAHSQEPDAPFFVGQNGKRVNIDTLQGAFRRIRAHAGLHRQEGIQPRLHDLRHTSAVHRLTSWYREGRDVQMLLPRLSVYMGHAHLASTQIYLTMTPDLLHEANLRFERYAVGGD